MHYAIVPYPVGRCVEAGHHLVQQLALLVSSVTRDLKSSISGVKRACKELCCMEGVCARVFTGQTFVMIQLLLDFQASISALSVRGKRSDEVKDIAILVDHYLRWIKRDAHSFGSPLDLALSNLKQPICSRARCAVQEPCYPRWVLGWVPDDFDPLESSIIGHRRTVNSVDWKRDKIASASSDGSVSIWDATTSSKLLEFRDHKDEVYGVSFSNSGLLLASGSKDSKVIIWCLLNEEVLQTLEGHSGAVLCVAWSADLLVASGSEDGMMVVWNVSSGSMLFRLECHGCVSSVSWSFDGASIMSGGFHLSGCCWDPGDIFVWRAADGRKLMHFEAHVGAVLDCKWSPDGSKIVSCGLGSEGWGCPGEILVWESDSGNRLLDLKGHLDTVTTVCWSPDSSFIATGSLDRTVIVWNARTGEQVSTFTGHLCGIHSVCWDPLGFFIASGGYLGDILIWRASVNQVNFQVDGHSAVVSCVSWSPDKSKIATGSGGSGPNLFPEENNPGIVFVWNCCNGKKLFKLKGPSGFVVCLDWSPDGCFIVSGGHKPGPAPSPWETPGEICVWNAHSGMQVAILSQSARIHGLRWSPTGCEMVSLSKCSNAVTVWSAGSWNVKHKLIGKSDGMSCACWSPDGSRIVTGSTWISWKAVGCPGQIFIWDSNSGDCLLELKAHDENILLLSWSGDGRFIASSSDNKSIILWNSADGTQISRIHVPGGILSTEWSEDGGELAVGIDNGYMLCFDIFTGNLIKKSTCSLCKIEGKLSWGSKVAALYGRSIVIWENPEWVEFCNLKLCETSDHDKQLSLKISREAGVSDVKVIEYTDCSKGNLSSETSQVGAQVQSVSMKSPDPTWKVRILSTFISRDSAGLWDSKWSPDGSSILCASSPMIQWNSRSGKVVSRFGVRRSETRCIAYSPDGLRIASGHDDHSVVIWNMLTGNMIHKLEGHSGWVQGICWSPDSAKIFSGGKGAFSDRDPGDLYVWDANTGDMLMKLEGHSNLVLCTSWSPDGKILVSGAYKEIFVWEAATGIRVLEMLEHSGVIKSVCFSPDGSCILSGCWDKTIIVWSAKTGSRQSTLIGHSGGVLSVDWCSDGTKIVSCGHSGTCASLGEIFVWMAADGKLLVQLKNLPGVARSVCWSPDSSKIASSSETGYVRIWALDMIAGGEEDGMKQIDREKDSVKRRRLLAK